MSMELWEQPTSHSVFDDQRRLIKKEETTPDCLATTPRGPGTTPLCSGLCYQQPPGTTAVSTRTADNALTAGYHNCTTRRRAINIVICWSAVVVHRTQPYSILHWWSPTKNTSQSIGGMILTGVQQKSEKNLSQCHSVHHKSQIYWPSNWSCT